MIFNKHRNLEGSHAFLGASSYHWVNYDAEKLANVYKKRMAVLRGTELHDYAAKAIKLGQKQPRSHKTINMYINDAIGYMMKPEQILFYSNNCFGTADAISFRNNKLRIHDLKTGENPANVMQLYIYAALFCLEYGIRPGDIEMELRIYQSDDILVAKPTAEDIGPIMDKIIQFDKIIEEIKQEEE